MHEESKQVPPSDEGTERLVLLQLLRDDRPERWSRVDLLGELYDVDADAIEDAVLSLASVGVVVLDGKQVRASSCAWRIDALDLISI